MGQVRVAFEAEHSETSRAALDEAVAGFAEALRTRGYQGVLAVEWSGDARRQSHNRDGTGGAVLERTPSVAGLSRSIRGKAAAETVEYSYESRGGGYYDLYEDGELVKTVRGKAAAEEWVAE